MKQHKNDVNPGPLTESGYSGRSCNQAILPDNDRAHLELPVDGHQRLMSIPGKGSPGFERTKAESAPYKELPLKTEGQNGNPGVIDFNTQVKSPGYPHCLGATSFRKRTGSMKTCPVKRELVVLYPNSSDEILQRRNFDILSDKALMPPGRDVFNFSSPVTQGTRKIRLRVKTCFLWRSPMNLPKLVVSLKELELLWRETKSLPYWLDTLIKQEYTCEAQNKILKASKLKLCQS